MSPRSTRPPRGRVGDDSAIALRSQLIDAAETLLAARPVSTITTRDITRTAGLSDGVLYNYFSDKTELLVAALIRRYAAALDRFGTGLPAAGTADVEQNLVVYVRAALDLITTTLPMAAGLISEPPLLHRFIAEIHGETYGPHRLFAPVADYLLAEQRLGRLRSFDPAPVLTLIMGPALMIGFRGLVMADPPREHDDQIPTVVRILMQGIGPQAS
jgi:AcrR family transcriptional regulator